MEAVILHLRQMTAGFKVACHQLLQDLSILQNSGQQQRPLVVGSLSPLLIPDL